jgi:dTDP-4-amino-4,6-dideoxygalactose transaminase
MKIPMLDVAAQHAPVEDALREAFERVMKHGQFILGPEVDAFEKAIAAYVGTPNAIGVSSGTDALLVALMALDVGPGDEVITTPFSFFATGGCISRLGAKPVFVDVEEGSFNLDPTRVGAAITERTKAIVPVHLFGQSANVAALRSHGLPVVEDAAQALGARSDEGPVGTLGALGCFSFFPSKNLGCFGDGGLVTTNDAALAEKVRILRAHGSKPKYFHAVVGGNFRLDALQAAILRVKLPLLDGWHEGRRKNAALYDRLFAEAGLPSASLRTPPRIYAGHVYNHYVIRTDRRDALQKHLEASGIATAIYYPLPLHLQGCFAELGYREGDLPVSERAAKEVLALPVYPELGEAGVRHVVGTVVGFLRG